MGRKFNENRDEVRATCVNVPLNAIERAKVEKGAKDMHVSMATYIRFKLFYEEGAR